VLIQESRERRLVSIGVVNEDYDVHKCPGWEGNTVGYHINDGNIFDRNNVRGGNGKFIKSNVIMTSFEDDFFLALNSSNLIFPIDFFT
jgi:hypothetical protein